MALDADSDGVRGPAEWAELPQEGADWQAFVASHPEDAAEAELARRVHQALAQLRLHQPQLPADFEARLLARCRKDATLLYLLDLALVQGGRLLVEVLHVVMAFLPPPAATAPPDGR